MRILFLLLALVCLATFAPLSLRRPLPPPAVSWVAYSPVPLKEGDPKAVGIGALRYLGGWVLTSNDFRFGGLSALHVEGDEALAISDAGWRIQLPLPGPRARVRVEIARLREGPGRSDRKQDRDAESLAVAGGSAWIGYEGANAVWRYDRARFAASASAAPPAMARWDDNTGPEAMVRLDDGRFLVFAEGEGGDSEVLAFAGDPAVPGTAALRLRYRPPEGYRVTDAALLPDGGLLLLNRRISLLGGFSAKLVLARLVDSNESPLIVGDEVATLEGPVTHDNMEALSVTREGARTILWIASDDNYNPFQRTLLMKFELVGGRAPAKAGGQHFQQ
ncbi:MAG: esterase-like activity of phytase family protein [Allosphingosinicella sp.]